jgi:hypothetical protein
MKEIDTLNDLSASPASTVEGHNLSKLGGGDELILFL